ncbi:MAG: HAMP domain-containing histidine kinase [Bacteroidetes bacterium]|nr:HAMP domain-containing histidine kinase [Bacteroidota bacterium]
MKKKSPLRLILFLGMISITGALITQMFWLKKAVQIKQANFDQNVQLALRRVAEHFDYSSTGSITPIDVVNKISSREFRLNLNDKVDVNLLDFYLRTELAYPGLDIDFNYIVYNLSTDSAVFQQFVEMDRPEKLYQVYSDLPNLRNGAYYAVVNFPTRSEYIGVKMTIWIFSSLVLLVSTFFFAYTILVIVRQRRLVESQKDFINNMAHELKTPLATITISAETLSSPEILEQPDRLLTYTNIIKHETDRLRNQVDKLLQMARMERDKIELHLEELNLHELIREVIPNLSLKLEDREGLLYYHLDAAEHIIKADKVHLTNIIYNLLDNAVKYTEGRPVIEVITKNENGNLLLSVRDNGIGIPKEYQEKIFEKFYRIPTGNIHDVKGFGLGLHYLKMVVNAHKWELQLTSEEGNGSTFTIVIPNTVKSATAAQKEEVIMHTA